MQAMASSLRSWTKARPILNLKILQLNKQTLPVTGVQQPWQTQQTRTRYVDWRMRRDAKRREMVKEYGAERLRLVAVKKNSVLPIQIRKCATEDLENLPRDSSVARTHKRCVVTSRSRGNLKRFRMSRIVWRKLADYNHLSGVNRASW